MGLIDADVLMTDVRNTITEKSGVFDWINLINRQPTAFDVDKVIEQLKLELEEVFEEDIAIEEFSKGTWNRAINKAIEIVKKGGEDNKGKIDKRRCH